MTEKVNAGQSRNPELKADPVELAGRIQDWQHEPHMAHVPTWHRAMYLKNHEWDAIQAALRATPSETRSNTKTLADQIEEEAGNGVIAFLRREADKADCRNPEVLKYTANWLSERVAHFAPSESATKEIRCVWVVEREYGYGKAMRVVASDHPRFSIGTRFDYGFLDIAVTQGYRVRIDPVPPSVQHDIDSARRERPQIK